VTSFCAFLLLSLLSFSHVNAAGDFTPLVDVVPAFPTLRFNQPVYLAEPPGDPSRFFVVEQDGRILAIRKKYPAKTPDVVLDISRKVRRDHMEEGLLGLAFDPAFDKNGHIFVQYSASNPLRHVVSRFTLNEWRTSFDPASELVILDIEKPYGNHNGGMLDFGPDGFLYASFGDGGSGGDPHGNAQNLQSLLGKILRIDVSRASSKQPYAIPADNPFVSKKDARGEIWAYGFRNVWRFSFDRTTGRLWAGDVGQVKREEIDVIEKGKNYGWNFREGKRPYKSHPRGADVEFVEPIADHDRTEAQSITGGYVYRGKKVPLLQGAYVYGDFVTANIWMIKDGKPPVRIAKKPTIASFGIDSDGEIYLACFDGRLYTFAPRE
jgi:glucose/arabinose dehydrogenase